MRRQYPDWQMDADLSDIEKIGKGELLRMRAVAELLRHDAGEGEPQSVNGHRPDSFDTDAIQQQIAAGLQAAIAGLQLRDLTTMMDDATHSAYRPGEAIEAEAKATLPAPTAHSTDFRSVNWFGQTYSFTANQAPVVRLLYENWQAGTPDIGDETLLAAVDPEAPPARLATLFRNHPAWGTMIVAGRSWKDTPRVSRW